MEIRGKRMKWRLQDMHPYILFGGFIGSILLSVAAFYAFVIWMIALAK